MQSPYRRPEPVRPSPRPPARPQSRQDREPAGDRDVVEHLRRVHARLAEDDDEGDER